MNVKMQVEFKVYPVDGDEEDLTENIAKSAASEAIYNYLSLVKVSGYSTDTPVVEVNAEGFGPCNVALGEDHE